MRILSAIGVAILFALLAIFAVENIRPAMYHFVGMTIPGNVWWTVAGSALLGFLIASLLMLPGRVTSGLRGRRSGRLEQELAALRVERDRVEQDFTNLRMKHDQVRAEHDQIRAERDQLRSQVATLNTRPTPSVPQRPAVVGSDGIPTERPRVTPEAERRMAPPRPNQPPAGDITQDPNQDIGQDSRPRELLPR